MLVIVQTMQRRRIGPISRVHNQEDGRIGIAVSRRSLQATFNELYDAGVEKVESTTKWPGKEPKAKKQRKDKNTGKKKTVYVYDQVVPKAGFLKALGMPQPWLKLWRDAIWSTLRGIPKTRSPYEERSRRRNVSEAAKLWRELVAFRKELAKGKLRTAGVVSCLFVGAQASSPERVRFVGRIDENLLLHFWPVVMQVYVPEVIDRRGERDFAGYVLAVPEVVDVDGFVDEFPGFVAGLKGEVAGYRPRDSIVSVPQEGALEYMRAVMQIAKARVHPRRQEMAYCIAGVEVYHLQKRGNTIPVLTSDRVALDQSVLQDYETVRERYRHPLFRRQIVLNILRGQPWYRGFDGVLSDSPQKLFVGRKSGVFSRDAGRKFRSEFEERRSAHGRE